MGHALVPAHAALREAGLLGECQREVEALEMPLKRSAVGHLLAASDARVGTHGSTRRFGRAIFLYGKPLPKR